MTFSISKFKSNLGANGVIQTNKYDVVITLPTPLLNGVISTEKLGGDGLMISITNDMQYRCIDAALPGIALRTTDTNRLGLGVLEKFPFAANYTDIPLTFICDKNGALYNFWYTWLNYVFTFTGEENSKSVINFTTIAGAASSNRPFYTAEYKDKYSGEITITSYNNSGNAAIICNLTKAYPTSFNDVKLNWGDNNNLMKLTVNITFREWAMQNYNTILSNLPPNTK